MKKLTQKQEKILSFVEVYCCENSRSPTYQDIQEHFGFASPNAATDHIRALRRKGYVKVQRGLSRNAMRTIISARLVEKEVPLVGRIAAGVPIEAIENIETKLDLSVLGIDNSNHVYFALTVNGNSMINAHILHHDIVVVKKQAEVKPNEIAVVLWNGEATIKYVKKSKNGVLLIPANDTMKPVTIRPEKTESFEIIGKVVTVIRKNC